MVELSYQIPTYQGKVLGFAWIRITTRIPEILVESILRNNEIPPLDRGYGYTIHELDSETLVEIRYPLQKGKNIIYSLWKLLEEIAMMEFE